MKITPLRTLALAGTAVVALVFSSTPASAIDVNIRVGSAPPPDRVERPWARPYRDAVWIGGHNEWRGGRWVWVGGYYAYPPHRGAQWIPGHYRRGYWRPGHWN
jgi:hypothetical protein